MSKRDKLTKDRISVMVGANMDGSEKLKLLVTGKSTNLRCFTGVKTLSVNCVENAKAQMTREICISWLKELGKKFSRENRKILLLLDNVQSHCKLPTLISIKIEYLPPNTRAFKEIEFPNFSEKFQCDITFAEYVAADNNLEVSGPLTAEEIVEIIHEKCNKEMESGSGDSLTMSQVISLPTEKPIAQSIECLRIFILMQPSSDKELKCLLQIEKLAKK